MNPEITRTSDGSDTLFRADLNQHYHSTFGAVQESQHIFITNGFLHQIEKVNPSFDGQAKTINIFEVGFGTGLNALLTLVEAERLGITVNYSSIELFPLEETCWHKLNYPHFFGSVDYSALFSKLHHASWNSPEYITPGFRLHKIHCALETYRPESEVFDLIYFDAFGPDAQPELWNEQIFRNLCSRLSSGGILVTYSVKGIVVRAMRAAGFNTEKLPGPQGKRHILRATKQDGPE